MRLAARQTDVCTTAHKPFTTKSPLCSKPLSKFVTNTHQENPASLESLRWGSAKSVQPAPLQLLYLVLQDKPSATSQKVRLLGFCSYLLGIKLAQNHRGATEAQNGHCLICFLAHVLFGSIAQPLTKNKPKQRSIHPWWFNVITGLHRVCL